MVVCVCGGFYEFRLLSSEKLAIGKHSTFFFELSQEGGFGVFGQLFLTDLFF